LAYYALFNKTKRLFTKGSDEENYTYFGFVIMFLIFSVSSFQLSFYLNPLFPFLAIITTAALFKGAEKQAGLKGVFNHSFCCIRFDRGSVGPASLLFFGCFAQR
jgi:hypothetical protein